MINVGIIGATGYTGEELINILLRHPQVRITSVSAKLDKPRKIFEIFPRFKTRLETICSQPNIDQIISKTDLVFLATPHTVSMEIVPKLLKAKRRVIDLSADYRIKDIKIYERFYRTAHKDKIHLAEAVYGLPEIYRVKIKEARLVANPGCYPTAVILALAPLVAFGIIDLNSIIIDAKSGTTGAGRRLTEDFIFSEINENFKAYKVNVHQHIPEINQELTKIAGKRINVTFVPHLLPLNRGILTTIYVRKIKSKHLAPDIIKIYKKFYKKEPFVRIRQEDDFPRIKDVVGTNFCDIGIRIEKELIIIISAIDNLLKGASGQAVQNMNIMYNFAESTALL
ncbi:MAG: N-acetyl-gamma-glutamyl-phosphate reductase [Candidatus Omnitrophica bacterium]|nr:N-acetyl-gamma-glutamyl-phosphate reductase [Candidatus Omnitrophota bacterium]